MVLQQFLQVASGFHFLYSKAMTYNTILTELVDGAIGLITLNRPESANALSREMAGELADAMGLAQNNPDIRAIVLTGSGPLSFCAGADLKERSGMSRAQWHDQHAAFEKARDAILHMPKPVIAAVNGAAMGGGFELALACDFIYAASHARFGLTESTLGIMPGMGGTQLLSRAIGTRRTKEALYLGAVFDAADAAALGITNRLCPAELLLQNTVSLALAISGNAPLAITAIKHAVDEGMSQPLDVALRTELRHYNTLLDTNDRHEGIAAWNEKRKPRFSGS